MRKVVVWLLIVGLCLILAQNSYAGPRKSCTKRYSKAVAVITIGSRTGVGLGWGLKAAFRSVAAKVITAAAVGTAIGQGISYGISTVADPDPVYWSGTSGPIFTSATDAEVDALLPTLCSMVDPSLSFTADDILALNDFTPGLGSAWLGYFRTGIRTMVDTYQGGAAYYAGRPEITRDAFLAASADVYAWGDYRDQVASLMESVTLQKEDETWIALEASPSQEGLIPYITLEGVNDWIDEVRTNGSTALPDIEVPIIETILNQAKVDDPMAVGNHVAAWVVSDGGLTQGEIDSFSYYEGSQTISQMFTTTEYCEGCLSDMLTNSELIPEPGSLLALSSGLIGLAGMGMCRRRLER